ncbi:MAG: hypothetical protein AAFQ82_27715, partial [Myxococcota bacterium]
SQYVYWLESEPEAPFTVEIVDSEGTVVRTLSSELEERFITKEHPDWRPTPEEPKPALPKKAGLNRATWDTYHAHADWIRGSANDIGGWGPGPRAIPGEYVIRLKVGEVTREQRFKLTANPASEATDTGLRSQLAFGLKLRAQLNEIVTTVRRIRETRAEVKVAMKKSQTAREIGETIVSQLDVIESELHEREARVSYDVLGGRDGGSKLYSVIGFLAANSLAHEGPPTRGMREVAEEAAAELVRLQSAFETLRSGDVQTLNEL